jgi:outer membrane protein
MFCFVSSPIQALTLNEAYQAALQHSLDRQIEESRLAQKRAETAQTRLGWRPSVTGSAILAHQDGADFAAKEQSTAKISLAQQLYRSATSAKTEASVLSERVQELKRDSVKLDLYSDVAAAYFGWLSAVNDLTIVESQRQTLESRLKEIKSRVRIGRSRPVERLSAEASIATLAAQMEEARSAINSVEKQLVYYLGKSAGIRATQKDTPKRPPLPNLAELIQASQSHPTVRALEATVNQLNQEISAVRAEYMPSLDFNANYFFIRPEPNKDVRWDVALALQVPIYDRGLPSGKIAVLSEKKNEQDLVIRQVKEARVLELEAGFERLSSLLKQISSYERAAELAQKNYSAQSEDYRLGLQTNLEVLQALTAVHESRRARDRAYFDYLTQYHQLIALSGRIP